MGFECVEELVGFEEGFEGDDGVEDLGTLWGVFEAFCFERASEDGAEGLDEFGLVCWFDGLEWHGGLYTWIGWGCDSWCGPWRADEGD